VPAQADNANAPTINVSASALISRMKGHEDDGMFFGADEALPIASAGLLPAVWRVSALSAKSLERR
jgi:hypothetical protein